MNPDEQIGSLFKRETKRDKTIEVKRRMSPASRLKNMEFNGTFLASIISFIVFVFLMNKILYAPILNIIEERRNFINGNLNAAEQNNAKAASISEEKDKMLVSAKDTARAKYVETLDEFKTQRSEIITEAQDKAKEELLNSNYELSNVSNEAKMALKGKMTDLANDIVEKVLGYRSNVEHVDNEEIDKILYQ